MPQALVLLILVNLILLWRQGIPTGMTHLNDWNDLPSAQGRYLSQILPGINTYDAVYSVLFIICIPIWKTICITFWCWTFVKGNIGIYIWYLCEFPCSISTACHQEGYEWTQAPQLSQIPSNITSQSKWANLTPKKAWWYTYCLLLKYWITEVMECSDYPYHSRNYSSLNIFSSILHDPVMTSSRLQAGTVSKTYTTQWT